MRRTGFLSIRLAATAGLLAVAGSLIAQSSLPSFDVASVKPVAGQGLPGSFSFNPHRTGGRLTWTTTLDYLTRYAYKLPSWRISGLERGPVFYTVEATMNPAATEDQVRQMMQTLLTDRFKMVTHRETKELSGYALVIGKNGSKLKTKSASGEAPTLPDYLAGKSAEAFEGHIFSSMEGVGTSAITGRGVTVEQLADELSEEMGMFVTDRTGLTGQYYFGFRFASIQSPRDDAQSSPVFSALQDDLGLRLDKQKGPVEMLVVDHIEAPSGN